MTAIPEFYQLVVFTLDQQRYALRLSSVETALRSLEVTPLPKGPEIVLGVINVRGRIIPVFNVRKRFGLPEREIDTTDQFIIANTSRRSVVLVTDAVHGVLERPAESVIPAERIVPGMEYVAGFVTLQDGMVFIHDLDKFLSLDEEKMLSEAAIGGTS
jgi:purine-binding chemotaxis protein CheW